jgi:serine/threonine protein kinase
MPRLQELSGEELHARAVRVFRQGGGSRPEVVLVREGAQEAVLKDYSRSDPAFRRYIGPLLVRREAQALRLLDGLPGVPRLIAVVNREALLIEHIDAPSARDLKPGAFAPEFFQRFYALIDAMHARGVAHCDLRSTGNILMTREGQPVFVDFVAYMKRGSWWNPLTRWLFGKFCEADRVAVARLKKTHAPQLLTEAEHAALARDRKTPLERLARVIGKSFRNVTRWLLTRAPRG